MRVCVCVVCCAFVGPDNELYKMHGTYFKMPTEHFLFR